MKRTSEEAARNARERERLEGERLELQRLEGLARKSSGREYTVYRLYNIDYAMLGLVGPRTTPQHIFLCLKPSGGHFRRKTQ